VRRARSQLASAALAQIGVAVPREPVPFENLIREQRSICLCVSTTHASFAGEVQWTVSVFRSAVSVSRSSNPEWGRGCGECPACWLSVGAQARSGQLTRELSRREDHYKDFIIAASKAYGDAIVSNDPQIQELVSLYAMISRMRVMSLPRTVTSADHIMRATIDTYFAPNKTIRELHDLMKNGSGIDPLKDFSEAARQELRAFTPL
jgi:hypothetical protein